jgi:hypothetical protein
MHPIVAQELIRARQREGGGAGGVAPAPPISDPASLVQEGPMTGPLRRIRRALLRLLIEPAQGGDRRVSDGIRDAWILHGPRWH